MLGRGALPDAWEGVSVGFKSPSLFFSLVGKIWKRKRVLSESVFSGMPSVSFKENENALPFPREELGRGVGTSPNELAGSRKC